MVNIHQRPSRGSQVSSMMCTPISARVCVRVDISLSSNLSFFLLIFIFSFSLDVTTGTFIEVDVDILEDVVADVGVNAM